MLIDGMAGLCCISEPKTIGAHWSTTTTCSSKCLKPELLSALTDSNMLSSCSPANRWPPSSVNGLRNFRNSLRCVPPACPLLWIIRWFTNWYENRFKIEKTNKKIQSIYVFNVDTESEQGVITCGLCVYIRDSFKQSVKIRPDAPLYSYVRKNASEKTKKEWNRIEFQTALYVFVLWAFTLGWNRNLIDAGPRASREMKSSSGPSDGSSCILGGVFHSKYDAAHRSAVFYCGCYVSRWMFVFLSVAHGKLQSLSYSTAGRR